MLKARVGSCCLFMGGVVIIQLVLLHFYSSDAFLPFVRKYLSKHAPPSNVSSNAAVNTSTSPNITTLSQVNAEVFLKTSLPVWNNASEKVAIIVAYRNRTRHLFEFLTRMLPFLGRQRKQYVLIVMEQAGDEAFNRAKLFNVAVTEIRRSNISDQLYGIDCFVLHDVDKVPASPFNLYECGQNVRQLITVVRSGAGVQRLYETFLGGATAYTWDHLKKINGASNLFTGWGGEDDELLVRLQLNNITVDRVSGGDGVFDKFNSKQDVKHSRDEIADRVELLLVKNVKSRWQNDGINQTHYELLNRINFDLFVWLLVSI